MNKIQETLEALKNEDIDPAYLADLVVAGELTKSEGQDIKDQYLFWLDLHSKVEDEQFDKESEKIKKQGVTDSIEKQGKIFTWGSKESNKKFDPIQPHHHIVIAGERGGGKTTYSFYLATENSKDHKVLYISLEMNTRELITSSCRKAANISKEQWRDKSLITDPQRSKYYGRKKEIQGLENLELLGSSNAEDNNIEKILEVITAKNPDLVFIDNLDLIRTRHNKDNERQEEISRQFMNYTNESHIPIIVLHHINKSGEIRGSKKIEDNADLILICSRNIPEKGEELDVEDQAKFNAVITKSRDFGEFVGHRYYFDKGEFKDQFNGQTGF